MPRLLALAFSISLDGYGAGPNQSRENPLGVGGEELHDWLVHTRTFKRMQGREGGETGVDDGFAARAMAGIGAWIMGRNMFGPIRGPWRAPGEKAVHYAIARSEDQPRQAAGRDT